MSDLKDVKIKKLTQAMVLLNEEIKELKEVINSLRISLGELDKQM